MWVRIRESLVEDRLTHCCALVYMSDIAPDSRSSMCQGYRKVVRASITQSGSVLP